MRYNDCINQTREAAELSMLEQVKGEDSLFLVNDTSLTRFLQLEQQLREATLIITEEEYEYFKKQMALDLWMLLTRDTQDLIEHTENRMIFMVRAFFLDQFKTDPSLPAMQVEGKRDDRLAFLYAIYVVATFSDVIDRFRGDTEDLDKTLNRIAEYQHRDLASLFDASYQMIEAYPREFVLIQREVIEVVAKLFASNQRVIHAQTRQLMKEARAIYQAIYRSEETIS